MTANDAAARSRRAQLVVWGVYVGIPVLFLIATVTINLSADQALVDWKSVLIPVAAIAGGWLFRERSRWKPDRWASVGAITGSTAALFGVFSTIVIGGPALFCVPAAVIGGVIGFLIGRWGEHQLLRPAVAGLGDTPYELNFRIRGINRLRLTVGDTSVTLRATVRARSADGDNTRENIQDVPLSVLKVWDTTLAGGEELEYPIRLDRTPVSTPGPALVVQTLATEWILPHDEAVVLAEILNRRIAAAAAPAS
ncbi:hypothetical protein HPO96_08480 [Kribbella sandramycini]|uniref:Uncharacterized protein n=1 Tax=Kribbella sandramycini TaxID=60450 RepID=A0A7Y4NXV5_9ACTN|nr:hypothetical protein [Kribbella sandramycini]MBB6569898.1 hypothetical protein [Kribbella sandramycini]NOL40277.1 hypothetical protein [Kribbella sandramycini]